MDNRYTRIVNALLTNDMISELANKTGVDSKKVSHLAIEILARMLGDGSDLNKANIEHRIKNVVKSEELKPLLHRLSEKYEITLADASKVLAELLPILFKKVHALDNAYFNGEPIMNKQTPKEEPKHQVPYAVKEEIKPVNQEEKETSVDDIFLNIEKRANQEVTQSKSNSEDKHVKKKKKFLFKKKSIKEDHSKEVAEGNIDNKELSIIEKVCMWVVLGALIALIGTILFLYIKQKLF